jgi:hypothetical protein
LISLSGKGKDDYDVVVFVVVAGVGLFYLSSSSELLFYGGYL